MLNVKTMLPKFRIFGRGVLGADFNKPGRLLLEWVPRSADGKADRDHIIRFGLSPEECGFVLDQLPKSQEVFFLRRIPSDKDGYGSGPPSNPDKVLYITPGQGGMVSFKVDFELDGVGGQVSGGLNGQPDLIGPLEVVVQAGEFQVILSLIQSSLPYLTGWTTSMEVALQHEIAEAIQEGTDRSYRGGSRFSSSDQGDRNVPS